ncbi:serine hydroxymethyltransferase, partial [Streptomyces sp. 2MCAF27]
MAATPAPPRGNPAGQTGQAGVVRTTAAWEPDFDALRRQDPDIAGIVLGELDRVRGGLQLIAAENFTSRAVLTALASPLA